MMVEIVKTNSGIALSIKTERLDAKRIIGKAIDWYHQQVVQTMKENGIESKAFTDMCCSAIYSKRGAFIELEPWGFASGTFNEPVMVGGSTPTSARAKLLLCYQSPLTELKSAGDSLWVKEIDVT